MKQGYLRLDGLTASPKASVGTDSPEPCATERYNYRAVQPPSIRIVWPVISEAALEAKNTTAPATSIGSPIRCNPAIRSITSARNSGFARHSSVPGVRINVGATAFTVMLYLPHSTARHLVKWAIAAFVMQYTDSVGSTAKPACELMLMMRPLFCRIIIRPAAWLAKNVPFKFTASVRSKSSSRTFYDRF